MAKADADDHWIVELLNVQPDDRILDIGCGPGVTVQLIAERIATGHVCGVDPSGVMLRQAAARNRTALKAGRGELRRGSAAALPYPNQHFAKACAVHSVYFWPSLEAGLREVHRVLAPAGLIVLAVRMRHIVAGVLDPSRYGYTDSQVADLQRVLRSVGFRDVADERRQIGRETITAITARR
jgi:ubiquinone/menaquinone biosynthesis C-methylase UbiE